MNNKYALVTGASWGLGEEFARQLAARGWSLILVARSLDRLERLRAELLERDPMLDVRCIPLDLTAPDAAVELLKMTEGAGLEISLLINNAGFGAFGEFGAMDRQRQRQMIDLNVAALVELSHLYLQPMAVQPEEMRRGGGIINIASIAGFAPLPYCAVYAATKAFVVSFSHALYQEARHRGVHVMVVNPGTTRTNFFEVAGNSPFSNPAWSQTAAQVVAESLRAFDRGKRSVTTGVLNRFNASVMSLVPRGWIAAVVAHAMRRGQK